MDWDKVCDDIHREFVESSSIKTTVNWEQVRIQAAIAAMQGILSNPSVPMLTKLSEEYQYTADLAVGYADALIEELKKEK